MATMVSWIKAVAGNFNNKTKWNPASVPGPDSDVYLNAPGITNYTVTSSLNKAIDYLFIDSHATLDVAKGIFTIDSLAGPQSNADISGKIDVDAGATLVFGATETITTNSSEIFNKGTVNLTGQSNNAASLTFQAAQNTLVGGGNVAMTGDASLTGGTTSVVKFENKNDTISGSGSVGGAEFYLQNDKQGTIDANGSARSAKLTVNTGTNIVYNSGLIETTGLGGMDLVGAGNSSSSVEMYQEGILRAAGSGALTLANAYVEGGGEVTVARRRASIVLDNGSLNFGGIISTVAGSSIDTVTGTTSNLIGSSDVENAGTVSVAKNSELLLEALVFNSGAIDVGVGSGGATLQIAGGGTTLLGKGKLVLSNSARNRIEGDAAPVTLANGNHLYGAGAIGDSYLRFANYFGALVDANDSEGLTINGDTDLSQEGSAYNDGVMETTNTGGLKVTGQWTDSGTMKAVKGALTFFHATVNGGGGIIETAGAGGSIVFDNGIDTGALISIARGGLLETSTGTTDEISQLTTIAKGGAIDVSNGSTLLSGNPWANFGFINIEGTTASTKLEVLGGSYLRLTGGGVLDLKGRRGFIVSNGSPSELQNEDNTIEGAGTIGDANLTLFNGARGTIDANGARVLTINTFGNQVQNFGTIMSNSAAGIAIDCNLYTAGYLIANKGKVDVTGTTSGTGLAEIDGASEIDFALGGVDVVFGKSADGELRLDNSSIASDAFDGSITGFTGKDRLDLSDIKYSKTGTSFSYAGGSNDGTLTVTVGTDTTTLWMIGDFGAKSFSLKSDGHGGTLVV